MGIPSYYKNIIHDFPDIIYPNQITYDNLFLDLNCAIHPCCANKTDEDEMMESILLKIKECIEITKVSKLVYIAIDGPAPRTKMEQQRHRRLKSAKEKKIWDTNAITPGTDFMNKLNLFLKEKCNDLPIPYIISDSNEPGEGEHKIMKYLDNHINNNTNNVVYGLDADLIMLSMIRKHNVYLLRETTEYNIENVNEPYIFLDVNLLKRYVIQKIKKPSIDFYINDQQILNDYLFICFLIGNDFIINSPCNNIRYNSIPFLITLYCDLQEEYFGRFFIIDEKEINFENFKLFIKKIAEKEKVRIDSILKKRKIQQGRNKHRFSEYLEKIKSIKDISKYSYIDFKSQDEKKFNDFVNYSPITFRGNEDIIFENENYRNKYYLYNIYDTFEYNPSYDMIIEEDITNICQEYFKAIEWTFHYYFNECISWRWYYKYHFAPLISDFSNYLVSVKQNTFEKDKPYSPSEQLKIVLPFQEKNNYYYPVSAPIYSFMKSYYWECHPILPH